MNDVTGFRDHFSGVGADYARHRPTHPAECLAGIVWLSGRHAGARGCSSWRFALQVGPIV